jgi:hypothetical protein
MVLRISGFVESRISLGEQALRSVQELCSGQFLELKKRYPAWKRKDNSRIDDFVISCVNDREQNAWTLDRWVSDIDRETVCIKDCLDEIDKLRGRPDRSEDEDPFCIRVVNPIKFREDVETLAYAMWEKSGKLSGRSDLYWYLAENDLARKWFCEDLLRAAKCDVKIGDIKTAISLLKEVVGQYADLLPACEEAKKLLKDISPPR